MTLFPWQFENPLNFKLIPPPPGTILDCQCNVYNGRGGHGGRAHQGPLSLIVHEEPDEFGGLESSDLVELVPQLVHAPTSEIQRAKLSSAGIFQNSELTLRSVSSWLPSQTRTTELESNGQGGEAKQDLWRGDWRRREHEVNCYYYRFLLVTFPMAQAR
ncbi:hypothetical protein QLX08_007992 [Tetragonisca angustula]|uniref:Uncharacterized protein n=1 Tax=Tetragonisca angustula TaxID=166442 RepID=A0AAW0ZQ55_9HYME